ncbi:L-cystine transport system permease protein TcyB [Gemmata obscuriglobus]|uniref:Amino acid ABC transporter permease n=1 Tax=Gemmata obscuriglobus TaxID=114 RepID=A0A2Z3H921_9BACT|nr:ABC transporter substrate-binding protein/permease [Gemmata obscuriglobus]AWM40037.1 amino acid ABC transporter permease [Gemmata obscuriglobus]QEG26805.1 L-cystine transport system permease protein TcyB [Gemmata obscuriglobus]VTS02705.1 amino acid abc transporter permease : Amine acid ABC transporter, permease protein, 3-TM region, His/Glu/Gln/Arg/opine family OS=Singulisphaera acidiphila (strain ATCC BAA-1392 / DSM 18658 / VKM B-2454 / MOB10) GN=Sinac_5234 PE=4 SV=1: SBP_bac_3: BPD_transp_1
MNRRWLLAAVAALALAPPAFGQDKKGLRWGTDPTGGAPFVYKEGDAFVGFEVELADYLARELGRTSKMVPGDWDKLPELLGKPPAENGIDIVLNGYELREDLEKDYPSTVPYYVYKLALVVHKDNANTIAGWADLGRENDGGGKRSVGVLGGSVAHSYLKSKRFGDRIELAINPDVATVVGLVEQKRLDATVQDTPAALYYVKHGKGLMLADEPRKPGFYVILTRREDNELRERLNAAINKGIKDGTLKSIYEKYGLWNEDQERLRYWTEQPWPPPFLPDEEAGTATETGKADWGKLLSELLRAARMTVFLAVTSFPLAMLVGVLVALGRVYGPWPLRVPLGVYVEVLRGTPLLLQLYFVFYLLPLLVSKYLGITLPNEPILFGVLGLAINYSAYEAENYRAGLLAVPRGQMEAALALGMSPLTALRVVIVPQAARIVIPPVTNDFIALFKDTSVCSVILIVELTRKYNELYNFNREYIFQLAFLTAGLYLLMSYPLAVLAGFLERRLGTASGGSR